MAIRKWHPGKLIILWVWGGIALAFALTDFLTRSVKESPLMHLVEIIIVLTGLFVLTAITWYWLGGKEN
jgi:hypothetical protein